MEQAGGQSRQPEQGDLAGKWPRQMEQVDGAGGGNRRTSQADKAGGWSRRTFIVFLYNYQFLKIRWEAKGLYCIFLYFLQI
jgi:hypothetical protein